MKFNVGAMSTPVEMLPQVCVASQSVCFLCSCLTSLANVDPCWSAVGMVVCVAGMGHGQTA